MSIPEAPYGRVNLTTIVNIVVEVKVYISFNLSELFMAIIFLLLKIDIIS